MILAFETATQVCSVALLTKEGTIIEKRSTGRGIHSEKVFMFLEQLLHEQKIKPEHLKEVLISRGPGTYTGLRIGAACIKGFLFGKKIPLFTLGTLEGFAAGLITDRNFRGRIHAVLDARREHLYYQKFNMKGHRLEISRATIERIEDIDRKLSSGDRVIGTGLKRLSSYDNTGISYCDESGISAKNLIAARKNTLFNDLFSHVNVTEFEPEYLAS